MGTAIDLLTNLATCLCAEVDPEETMCFCGMLVGEAAVADYVGDCKDGCGMSWVRLGLSYPANGVGVQALGPNCGSMLGLDIEVGTLRCIITGHDDGTPPTQEEMLTASIQQANDMQAMRRAINCCEGSDDFILGSYQPAGPQGGVVGGAWTLYAVVNN